MSRHTQNALVYDERREDIATISDALHALSVKDIAAASQILVAYMDKLQQAQTPRVVEYDQAADLAAYRRRHG